MFKLDMRAIRQSASDSWLMANAANLANLANGTGESGAKISQQPPKLAGLAKLAISQQRECTLQTEPVPDPASSEPGALGNLRKPQMAQAANDPTSSEPTALEEPPALDKPKLKFLEWADGWIELDKAYQRHHWGCPQCKAAGRGAGYGLRCGVGAALYRAYSDAAEDRSALDW